MTRYDFPWTRESSLGCLGVDIIPVVPSIGLAKAWWCVKLFNAVVTKPLESIDMSRGLSPGSRLLSVADMSMNMTKGGYAFCMVFHVRLISLTRSLL